MCTTLQENLNKNKKLLIYKCTIYLSFQFGIKIITIAYLWPVRKKWINKDKKKKIKQPKCLIVYLKSTQLWEKAVH